MATTSKNVVVAVRMPQALDELIEMRAQDSRIDKADTIRQWLWRAAEEYALELAAQGRITETRAAELLDLSIWDIHRLAREQGIELGATEEQQDKSRRTAAQLAGQSR